jgi:hypothetical protein
MKGETPTPLGPLRKHIKFQKRRFLYFLEFRTIDKGQKPAILSLYFMYVVLAVQRPVKERLRAVCVWGRAL